MEQSELLRFTLNVLENLAIPYMLVGSMASMAYGEARLTQDLDIVIEPTVRQVRLLCRAFPAELFYVSVDAALQALNQFNGQFNVIDPESGNKIDFMIARKDAWGRAQLARRQKLHLLPDSEGFVARPEDVIIGKLLYYQDGGSEKHLRDIAGMLKISGKSIDRGYIETWSSNLGVSEIWEAIVKRLSE